MSKIITESKGIHCAESYTPDKAAVKHQSINHNNTLPPTKDQPRIGLRGLQPHTTVDPYARTFAHPSRVNPTAATQPRQHHKAAQALRSIAILLR
jgi:hypothetical protein